MEKETKKSQKLAIIIIILIISLIGTTYAYMNFNASANTTNNAAGCFVVDYSAQEINTTNLSATTNYLEGAKTTVTLSKNANCEIYTEANIYIKTNNETTAPISDPQALKFKVYNGDNLIQEGTISEIGDTLIAENLTLTNTPTNYTIYIWIDANISKGSYNSTTYSGYIYATSTQTSTINK